MKRTTRKPVRNPGDQPHSSLTLEQIDRINLLTSRLRSRAVLAIAGLDHGDRDDDLLANEDEYLQLSYAVSDLIHEMGDDAGELHGIVAAAARLGGGAR